MRMPGLLILMSAATAQAANPYLFVVSDAGGPTVKVYGTNRQLTLDPPAAAAAPGLPEEFIVTSPPYEVTDPEINPGLAGLRQPFGPLGKGASVFTIPLDFDINALGSGCGAVYEGHDIIVIGSGPGIVPPRVQVWANYSNALSRAERDAFRKIVEFPIVDFGIGYSAGIHVAAGDYNGDGDLDIVVGRRNGEPRLAFHTLDGSLMGPWATLTEFQTDLGLPADPDAVISEYLLPQTGNNELVAYPEVPAGYNGGVRPTTLFQYGDAVFSFQYSVLATAPGPGFKPWVKVWFVHDGTQHIPTGGNVLSYCFPQDVALAQAHSPFVVAEFLAFAPSFKGGVNLAAFTDDPFGLVGPFENPESEINGTALLCGSGKGAGVVNIFAQTPVSPSFDKIHSFKPLGASYTGGVGVSSADRSLDLLFDIVAFPASRQTGALSNARFFHIATTAQGDKVVEDVLQRFKPFGNKRFHSSP